MAYASSECLDYSVRVTGDTRAFVDNTNKVGKWPWTCITNMYVLTLPFCKRCNVQYMKPVQRNVQNMKPVQRNVQNLKLVQINVQNMKPVRRKVQNMKPVQNNVHRKKAVRSCTNFIFAHFMQLYKFKQP